MPLRHVPVDIPRNRWGQPLIVAPGGDAPEPYQRVTNFIDVLEDKTALYRWQRGQALLAVARDYDDEDAPPDEPTLWEQLRKLAKSTERSGGYTSETRAGKRQVYTLLDAADRLNDRDAGTAASRGTAIHALTELVDLGGAPDDDTPAELLDDLAAYRHAMRLLGAEPVEVERFVVVDEFRIGGTMDRALAVRLPGFERPILAVGDIKSGNVEYGNGKAAMQMAAYARGQGYDPERPTERTALGLNTSVGLLIHLPRGVGVCTVHVMDLEAGYRGLQLAAAVHAWRAVSGECRREELVSTSAGDAARWAIEHAEHDDEELAAA